MKLIQITNSQQMNAVKQIIKDIFGRKFFDDFIEEVTRICKGQNKVSLIFPTVKPLEVKTFRKEVNELYDMAISARKAINLYIQQNEPEINKADFFKKISALTKSLPPLTEIQKIKVKSNF